MPNSLKSRLKKLEYQGLLSEKDLSRIYTDKDVVEELEKIKAEIIKGKCKHCDIDVNIQKCLEEHNSLCDVDDILVIIDNRLKELNNE